MAVRQKNLFGWLIVTGAAAAAVSWLSSSSSSTSAPQRASTESRTASREAASGFAALPARETLGASRADPFLPPASPSPLPSAAAPAEPPKPVLPAMPYRAAGRIAVGGQMKTLLAKGTALLEVQEGDSLEGGYRVEAIRPEYVTLLYVPLGVREDLPMASALAESPPAATPADSSPALLRWAGPAQVQTGDLFDVALKLTSKRSVRHLPMQLSYDAKALEAISVQAGNFFSTGGNLEYRISPNGSILVAAYDTVATAAAADFIILTFRPIRAGATAEVSISSVTLRDADGRAMALDRPEAFRATVVQ